MVKWICCICKGSDKDGGAFVPSKGDFVCIHCLNKGREG